MAASGKYAVLDIDDEMDLQFQDFGDTHTSTQEEEETEKGTHTHHFTNFPDTHIDDDDDDDEINNKQQQQQQEGAVLPSPLSLQYYQTYFNVDSKQVLERLIHSVLPKPGRNYLYMYIRPNPDLYGPFWISLTLSFTTAITGNLANYLMTRPGDVHTWKYDFNKVSSNV
ncbi:hypothetical protein Pcinc_000221 [Petrolisthes cinctipes]|uniref:Protein YIPF n=1 Tax=Petrolisthes cinctipes TaxID=88211 RepID=A0AAE1GPZ5_PETCI|nr:hypothetical protein Pcinc_000221 [Petrolisthes cinctipes]